MALFYSQAVIFSVLLLLVALTSADDSGMALVDGYSAYSSLYRPAASVVS